MKILYIAEKAKVGRAIASALGGLKSNQGYLEGKVNNDDVFVTWCSGHMLELFAPADYDIKYKTWNFETLPFCFSPYKKKVSSDKSKQAQLKIIKSLLATSDMVVNAGDPDDEGQLIVDDLVRFYNFKKPVKRILINDNNEKVVKKAIEKMVDNEKFEHMGWQAEARSVADQTLGLNFTRAYTLLNRLNGGEGVVSAGRVQSAMLGLVVRRTIEFNNHKENYFHTIQASFEISGIKFSAKFNPSDKFIESNADKFDEKNRIIDADFAKQIVSDCNKAQAVVRSAETLSKSTPPPLPYNLIKLQQKASNKFNYDPDEVMKITQSLKDKDLITYNRTDSQYLNDEHFNDASSVLGTLKGNIPDLASGIASADASYKGRVFDDSKTTAHHAIIPSEKSVDVSSLTVKERNIYMLIASSYIIQFYPDYEYNETKILLEVGDNNHAFTTTSNKPTKQGWKDFENDSDDDSDDDSDNKDDNKTDLATLNSGESGLCALCDTTKEKTKPKPLYTMSTLLGDLTSASKYIKNPKLAKILKERDKDKKGESGGIGTPATRDSIIKLLFKRDFIEKKGKKIISTKQGDDLYNSLSDAMKYPDLSAIWVEKFKGISSANDVTKFIDYVLKSNIEPEINNIKENKPAPAPKKDQETALCPVCKAHNMVRRNGKFGWYWGCLGYRDEDNQCKNIMNDVDGKPVAKVAKEKPVLSEFKCDKCDRPLIFRKGSNGRGDFWGCSGYSDKKKKCSATFKDDDGKPVYEKKNAVKK